MALFQKKKDKPVDKVERNLEQLETSIQKDLESKKTVSKWSRGFGIAALVCTGALFVAKAIVLLEVLPVLVLGYGISKMIGYSIDKGLNDKYVAQANLIAAQDGRSPKGQEPDGPSLSTQKPASSEFDAAARIVELEKQVQDLSRGNPLKASDIVKPKQPLK